MRSRRRLVLRSLGLVASIALLAGATPVSAATNTPWLRLTGSLEINHYIQVYEGGGRPYNIQGPHWRYSLGTVNFDLVTSNSSGAWKITQAKYVDEIYNGMTSSGAVTSAAYTGLDGTSSGSSSGMSVGIAGRLVKSNSIQLQPTTCDQGSNPLALFGTLISYLPIGNWVISLGKSIAGALLSSLPGDVHCRAATTFTYTVAFGSNGTTSVSGTKSWTHTDSTPRFYGPSACDNGVYPDHPQCYDITTWTYTVKPSS